jgi:hypothetical protein
MNINKDPLGSKGETPDVAFEAELILEVLHKKIRVCAPGSIKFFPAICCLYSLKQAIFSRQQTSG